MTKPKKTWLENIQTGAGLKVSREFFLTQTNETEVSKKLYPNRLKNDKGKVQKKITSIEPTISRLHKEYNELGFFTYSRKLPIEDRWGRIRKIQYKIMNLEPVVKYSKEKYNIDFSKEEKEFLFELTLSMREKILNENPDKDVINAFLNYYQKHYIIQFSNYYTPEKMPLYKTRLEQINKPKFWKFWDKDIRLQIEINKASKKIKESMGSKPEKFEIIDLLKNHNQDNYFDYFEYLGKRKKDPNFIISIDKKILKMMDQKFI